MAMNVGGAKDHVADINMTPMIDVLLVLLVIFMIAQPLLQKLEAADLTREGHPVTEVCGHGDALAAVAQCVVQPVLRTHVR